MPRLQPSEVFEDAAPAVPVAEECVRRLGRTGSVPELAGGEKLHLVVAQHRVHLPTVRTRVFLYLRQQIDYTDAIRPAVDHVAQQDERVLAG